VNPGGRSWNGNPSRKPQPLGEIHFLPLEEIHPPNFLSQKINMLLIHENFNPPKLKCPKCQPETKPLPTPKFLLIPRPETNSSPPEKMAFPKKKRKTSLFATHFSGGKITAISFKDWY